MAAGSRARGSRAPSEPPQLPDGVFGAGGWGEDRECAWGEDQARAPAAASSPTDPVRDKFTIHVRLTGAQFREINERAGLGPFDGRARGEYILRLRAR
jgi:hypothetical protein